MAGKPQRERMAGAEVADSAALDGRLVAAYHEQQHANRWCDQSKSQNKREPAGNAGTRPQFRFLAGWFRPVIGSNQFRRTDETLQADSEELLQKKIPSFEEQRQVPRIGYSSGKASVARLGSNSKLKRSVTALLMYEGHEDGTCC